MFEFYFSKNYFLSFTIKIKTTLMRLISLNNSKLNKINKNKSQFNSFAYVFAKAFKSVFL